MDKKTKKETKVFLAFFRIDYEGIYEDSMKLFKRRKQAESYIKELREKHNNEGGNTYDIKELFIL